MPCWYNGRASGSNPEDAGSTPAQGTNKGI